jgi:hypothetical protein
MDNIFGPPVRGKHLKYRDSDIAQILSRLNAGNSILLIGLRRIGKSSVMRGIVDRAPDSWITSYQDMQHKKWPADIFTAFITMFHKNHRKQFQTYVSQLKTLPGRVSDMITKYIKSIGTGDLGIDLEFNQSIIEYWNPLIKGIEKIITSIHDPILLVLDEFPVYIELMLKAGCSPEIVQRILGLLKDWRSTFHHFRMVAGGSISLDRILAKNTIHGATINDFSRYLLEPFKRSEAKALLDELAASYGLDWYKGKRIEETLDLISDFYPFFLQGFFQELRAKGSKDGPSIKEIFENHFIPSIQRGFFDQFLNRLRSNYPEIEKKTAFCVLDFISKQNEYTAGYSAIRAEVEKKIQQEIDLDSLLYDLVSDEFLSYYTRTAEYTFATKLVATWWRMTRGRV